MNEEAKANETGEDIVEEPRNDAADTDVISDEAAGADSKVELTMVSGGEENPCDESEATVRDVQFDSLPQGSPCADAGGIDLLMDVRLDLSVELGRTVMPVRGILQLGPGSVVELEKPAGEPVDVYINGKLIARGEVVVVDDNFGVRVTEIVNRQDGSTKAA